MPQMPDDADVRIEKTLLLASTLASSNLREIRALALARRLCGERLDYSLYRYEMSSLRTAQLLVSYLAPGSDADLQLTAAINEISFLASRCHSAFREASLCAR